MLKQTTMIKKLAKIFFISFASLIFACIAIVSLGLATLEIYVKYKHYLSETESKLLIEWFIKSGANLNSKDTNGKTILMRAIENHYPPYIIDQIAKSVVDLNVQDNLGDTALIVAVKNLDLIATINLLEAGANKSIKNNLGKTAIDYAKANNDFEILDYLEDFS